MLQPSYLVFWNCGLQIDKLVAIVPFKFHHMLWQVSLIRYALRLSTFDPSNEFIYFVDICWRLRKRVVLRGLGVGPDHLDSFGPRSFRKSTAWRILCCALQKRTICYQKMAPFYVQIQMLWALPRNHGGSRWHVWQRNGMCLWLWESMIGVLVFLVQIPLFIVLFHVLEILLFSTKPWSLVWMVLCWQYTTSITWLTHWRRLKTSVSGEQWPKTLIIYYIICCQIVNCTTQLYGCFPKIVGFPPQIIHFNRDFPFFSPSILGVFPIFGNRPYGDYNKPLLKNSL